MAFLFSAQSLWAGEAVEGSGAMEVVYEHKVCITDPCPQYKIIALNGEAVEAMGADLINLDANTLPSGKPAVVMGSWVREGNYFKVKVKEWILVARQKVEEKKEEEKK